MRVIIAGSRDFGRLQVEAAIRECLWSSEITEVVSGTAAELIELAKHGLLGIIFLSSNILQTGISTVNQLVMYVTKRWLITLML